MAKKGYVFIGSNGKRKVDTKELKKTCVKGCIWELMRAVLDMLAIPENCSFYLYQRLRFAANDEAKAEKKYTALATNYKRSNHRKHPTTISRCKGEQIKLTWYLVFPTFATGCFTAQWTSKDEDHRHSECKEDFYADLLGMFEAITAPTPKKLRRVREKLKCSVCSENWLNFLDDILKENNRERTHMSGTYTNAFISVLGLHLECSHKQVYNRESREYTYETVVGDLMSCGVLSDKRLEELEFFDNAKDVNLYFTGSTGYKTCTIRSLSDGSNSDGSEETSESSSSGERSDSLTNLTHSDKEDVSRKRRSCSRVSRVDTERRSKNRDKRSKRGLSRRTRSRSATAQSIDSDVSPERADESDYRTNSPRNGTVSADSQDTMTEITTSPVPKKTEVTTARWPLFHPKR